MHKNSVAPPNPRVYVISTNVCQYMTYIISIRDGRTEIINEGGERGKAREEKQCKCKFLFETTTRRPTFQI